ncbi:unnamed protein product [Rotaria sp. Silwood1]|nr:unnamed protein product [Rotaria sp. Silwood1]
MGNQHPKKTTPTVLTNEEINMLKENTEFTEKEIREWHANFIRDCPTGRIDRKKFSEFYKQFCPDGKVESYCKHAFTTFDKNNDGAIDFEEFLLAIAATSQGSIDTRLAFAFDV